MTRALVAIGVSRIADSMPPLQAAAEDAQAMSNWARGQRIHCRLITDQKGHRVTKSTVCKAIRDVVESGSFSQLIVYFSGHGLLLAPDCEVWLLSGAPEDPNESINVSGSIAMARNCGIRHVVIISDACRTPPNNPKLRALSSGLIFPPRQGGFSPEVDTFYATLPGEPALEVGRDESLNSRGGLLTEYLLRALRGKEPSVVEQWQIGDGLRHVVPSRPLRQYLAEKVSAAAAELSVKLNQLPDVRVESAAPNFLSDVTKNVASLSSKSFGQAATDHTWEKPFDFGRIHRPNRKDAISQPTVSTTGLSHFGYRTGFVIHGARVRAVIASGNYIDFSSRGQAVQVGLPEHMDTPGSRPRSALILLESGKAIVLAIFPAHIGVIAVVDESVWTVNYTPSRGSRAFEQYFASATFREQRLVELAAEARKGLFGAGKLARELSPISARTDPTLSIYAAYAYAQTGNAKALHDLYHSLRDEPHLIAFDVAMLAMQSAPGSDCNLDFAPWMPMLTQGWMLLGPFEDLMPAVLRALRRHLLPSVWTMFSPAGAEILEDVLAARSGARCN